jgi:hypothetical protein
MVSLSGRRRARGNVGTRARAARLRRSRPSAPSRLGDTLEVPEPGGILGRCTSENPEIGPPFRRKCWARS